MMSKEIARAKRRSDSLVTWSFSPNPERQKYISHILEIGVQDIEQREMFKGCRSWTSISKSPKMA
jgi:hypothetical protein